MRSLTMVRRSKTAGVRLPKAGISLSKLTSFVSLKDGQACAVNMNYAGRRDALARPHARASERAARDVRRTRPASAHSPASKFRPLQTFAFCVCEVQGVFGRVGLLLSEQPF